MAKKILYGLRNVYYAPITDGTYGTPVALNGAVGLTINRVGEDTNFYADDIIYYVSKSNQGYEGELEVAMITDEFAENILGMKKDSNGALIEGINDEIKDFALGIEIQTNDKPRRIWFYNCSASRVDENPVTKQETTTPQTQKIAIKMQPRVSDGKVKVMLDKTALNESAFNSFFTKVYEEASSI